MKEFMNIMLKDYKKEHFTRTDWQIALVVSLALSLVLM